MVSLSSHAARAVVPGLMNLPPGRLFLSIALLAGLAGPVAGQVGLEVFDRDVLVIRTADGEEHRFDVEMALTGRQQSQGLMYRPSLAPDGGMLFVHRPARTVSMWMRNTALPLDMLFIAEDGEIVKIVERAVPYSLAIISSGRPVRGVLEVNGGTASRLGLRPGDKVVHSAFGSEP